MLTERGQGNVVRPGVEEVPHDGRASTPVSPPPSRSVSTSHLYERPEADRGAPADHPWERTSAEERDEWAHTDWGWSADW